MKIIEWHGMQLELNWIEFEFLNLIENTLIVIKKLELWAKNLSP
jgi:hypothetical protein